jgi:hypothetical protein
LNVDSRPTELLSGGTTETVDNTTTTPSNFRCCFSSRRRKYSAEKRGAGFCFDFEFCCLTCWWQLKIENFGGANNGRHLALDMGTVCCAPLPRPANRPSPQPPSPANIGQHQQQQVKVKHLTNKTKSKK